jgi:hypothetical protein
MRGSSSGGKKTKTPQYVLRDKGIKDRGISTSASIRAKNPTKERKDIHLQQE